MEDIQARKLSIYVSNGIDKDGKDVSKVKTFANVRLDTTKTELTDFRDKYLALSSGAYLKALVADYYML